MLVDWKYTSDWKKNAEVMRSLCSATIASACPLMEEIRWVIGNKNRSKLLDRIGYFERERLSDENRAWLIWTEKIVERTPELRFEVHEDALEPELNTYRIRTTR